MSLVSVFWYGVKNYKLKIDGKNWKNIGVKMDDLPKKYKKNAMKKLCFTGLIQDAKVLTKNEGINTSPSFSRIKNFSGKTDILNRKCTIFHSDLKQAWNNSLRSIYTILLPFSPILHKF